MRWPAGRETFVTLDAAGPGRDNECVSANPPADAGAMLEVGARAEAERSGRPFLELRDGGGRERVFVFAPGADSASVGRRSSSDLVLDWDDQVSRLHARFECQNGGWELVDDGISSNGTFVNERRLNGREPLRSGDVLRFGATEITYHAPASRAARAEADRRPTTRGRGSPRPRGTQRPRRHPRPRGPSAPWRPARPRRGPPRPAGAPSIELSSTQRRVLAALCRPYKGGNRFATPATDDQIAEDLILSVGEVRTHLRILCAKLGITNPSTQDTRVRVVERAFSAGLISEQDL